MNQNLERNINKGGLSLLSCYHVISVIVVNIELSHLSGGFPEFN